MVSPCEGDTHILRRKTKIETPSATIFFDWERSDRPEHRLNASHSKIACFSRLANLKNL